MADLITITRAQWESDMRAAASKERYSMISYLKEMKANGSCTNLEGAILALETEQDKRTVLVPEWWDDEDVLTECNCPPANGCQEVER